MLRKKYDNIWEADVTYFIKKGEFRLRIKVLSANLNIQGELAFQTCTDLTGRCIPGFQDIDFSFIKVVSNGASEMETENKAAVDNKDYSQLLEAEGGGSLWGFFIAAFLFGLGGTAYALCISNDTDDRGILYEQLTIKVSGQSQSIDLWCFYNRHLYIDWADLYKFLRGWSSPMIWRLVRWPTSYSFWSSSYLPFLSLAISR